MRFWFFFVMLAITIVSVQATGKKQKLPTKPSEPEALRRNRWRSLVPSKHLLGQISTVVGGILTIAGGVYGIWGPFWPTAPEVLAHDVSNESKVTLPFRIMNKNNFFAMKSVRMICVVQLMEDIDARGKIAYIGGVAHTAGTFDLPRDVPLNFPCSANGVMNVDANGDLTAFASHGSFVNSKGLTPPLTTVKMCVYVKGLYKVFGILPWSFTSDVFQWPAAENSNQWLQGVSAISPPSDQNSPDARCRPSGGPYGLADDPGPLRLFQN